MPGPVRERGAEQVALQRRQQAGVIEEQRGRRDGRNPRQDRIDEAWLRGRADDQRPSVVGALADDVQLVAIANDRRSPLAGRTVVAGKQDAAARAKRRVVLGPSTVFCVAV